MTAILCCSCEKKSGGTIEEPDITAEYLTGEYANQLTTDGAEIVTGVISLEKKGDAYVIHIVEKKVIPNSDYDEGYYIADTNVEQDVTLGTNARIVGTIDGEPAVLTTDKLLELNAKNADQLYTLYLMGNSAELVLAADAAQLAGNAENK